MKSDLFQSPELKIKVFLIENIKFDGIDPFWATSSNVFKAKNFVLKGAQCLITNS